MNKPLLIASILAVYVMGYYGFGAIDAYAQYLGNVGDQGETGARTLEEQLELARRAVEAVNLNPQAGSGTPILAADGVFGAVAVSVAIFGGIAVVLFYKGKQGKYAAQGRG